VVGISAGIVTRFAARQALEGRAKHCGPGRLTLAGAGLLRGGIFQSILSGCARGRLLTS
jgi:hypothetical protein